MAFLRGGGAPPAGYPYAMPGAGAGQPDGYLDVSSVRTAAAGFPYQQPPSGNGQFGAAPYGYGGGPMYLPPGPAPASAVYQYMVPEEGGGGRDPCSGLLCGSGGRGPRRSDNEDAGGCLGQRDPSGVMTFVGDGGDYVTDTSYRYVGRGAGQFQILSPSRVGYGRLGCCLCLALVAVIGLVAAPGLRNPGTPSTTQRSFVLPPPSPTTTPAATTTTTTVLKKTCLFWGDPHVSTFDGAVPSFYGEGEFWIIKSPMIRIQGRYNGTRYTDGLAATHKMVISGEFIDGARIEVGSLTYGDIEFDDADILSSLGAAFSLPGGKGTISYDADGELIDEAQGDLPRRVVHMQLPLGLEVTVFRWKNYIDMRIESPPIPGTDGSCGNYNGDKDDDDTRDVFERIGPRVAPGENLFSRRAQMEVTHEMLDMIEHECIPDVLTAGEVACRSQLPEEQTNRMMVSSCVFDYCFGAEQHALRTAAKFD